MKSVRPKTSKTKTPKTASLSKTRGRRRRSAPGVKAGPSAARSKTRFPVVLRADGCGVALYLAERAGATSEYVSSEYEVRSSIRLNGNRPKKRSTVGGRRAVITEATCRALSTLGHLQRVRILMKLLDGPCTYAALQKVSKLKAGPLYHHINQLRLSGLVLPKQRDLYELTRGGRNLALVAIVAGSVARDVRRRPLA